MAIEKQFNKTLFACFAGYIVQAIVNNFVPLLFLTFRSSYGIPLSKATMLITVNFGLQLLVDLLSAGLVDKIGYRTSAVLAHLLAASGLVMLTALPERCGDPFSGILLSVAVYAVGGGLLEVLVSPIVESCPTKNKETTMSLLHSFYCWGHVAVVLLSTIFFSVFGIHNWKSLAVIWAVVPVLNGILFCFVPLAPLREEGEAGLGFKGLIKSPVFWRFMLMMLCAGASEQAVSQWASTFAEKGLGVPKTIGDLAGPMAFAVLMGLSRTFYGRCGEKIDLDKFMSASCFLCVLSYLCVSFAPIPLFALLGCAACGLSVGIMWPGTFSKAASALKGGGTVMFALLALAGDLGCSASPTIAGIVSSALGDNLRLGILSVTVFPVLLLIGVRCGVHSENRI